MKIARSISHAPILGLCLALSACLGGGGSGGSAPSKPEPAGSTAGGDAGSTAGGDAGGNTPPVVTDTPPSEVRVGQDYSYTPAVEDDGGDLTFSVENLPDWASFDPATGRIEGQPGPGDIGTHGSILIQIDDGEAATSMPPFSISVVAVGSGGNVTLSWVAPTENTDGTPLLDLAGYTIYWGRGKGEYEHSVDVGVGITSYVIENLTPGKWFFATRAFNSSGVHSDYSNEASKLLR